MLFMESALANRERARIGNNQPAAGSLKGIGQLTKITFQRYLTVAPNAATACAGVSRTVIVS